MKRNYQVTAKPFAPAMLEHNGEAAGTIADHYFDPPAAQRALEIVSTSADAEGPTVFDNGVERAVHTRLVSASFAVHPMFGPGHVLRTDGRVAAFWNGEMARVVHLTNLKFIAVTQGRNEPKVSDIPKGGQRPYRSMFKPRSTRTNLCQNQTKSSRTLC